MRLLKPIFNGTGRVIRNLADAADAALGDVIILRDMKELIGNAPGGTWEFRPYSLANGETGEMLQAFGVYRENPEAAIPPELTINFSLKGTYAVWIGVPGIEIRKNIFAAGADLALDGELYTFVTPVTGTRHGKRMGPVDCEKFVFWKTVKLDGRIIRIRSPFGQFGLWPYGMINSSISSFRLVKVDPHNENITSPIDKHSGFIIDGFSHYLNGGGLDETIDERFVEIYKDFGVDRIIWQSPATCSVAWPSALTDIPGASVADWEGLRICDRRIHDYIAASIERGNEGIRSVSEKCRREGMEFHLSIRMNLVWKDNPRDRKFGEFINGRWWREHPEARISGSQYLDYARPDARAFICGLVAEAAGKYDLDGFCMDLTRWPPVFGGANHDNGLLPLFLREMRDALDKVRSSKKIKLGFIAVDGYHANAPLEAQHIDIESALATDVVDYFGVQAWKHDEYIRLARKYGADYLAVIEQEPVDAPGGYRADPLWQDPVLHDSDPIPGEEFWDVPRVGGTLSPQEFDIAIVRAHSEGADGVLYSNCDNLFQLGSAADSTGSAERLESGGAFGQRDGHSIII